MAIYFRCKSCGGEHLSPIEFDDEETFEFSDLSGNIFDCPETGEEENYDKEDMFWKEEEEEEEEEEGIN
jgi:hypothetical protein